MPVPFEGFCGASYELGNKYAAVERLVNWYLQPIESPDEKKSRITLEPMPGNKAFCTLPVPAPFNQRNRGLIELRGMAYGVNGGTVFSIDSNGAFTNIGSVVDNGIPVSMKANGNGQILIASSGNGYVIPSGGGAGSLIEITTDDFLGAAYVAFQDGYHIVLTPGTNQYQISGDDDNPVGNCTLWNAANVNILTGQQDYLKAIISSREYLRILGARRSQVHYNVGNNGIGGFPFQSYSDTIIETGIAAPFSLVDMGDSLIWIGEDDRGKRACWQDHAFSPAEINDLASAQAWEKYSRIDDAIAFCFTWNKHLFYQVTFPTPNKTWVYDQTSSKLLGRHVWFERQYLDAWNNLTARSEQFHCYCYGKHLVGSVGFDGNPGAIYVYGSQSDCGTDQAGNQVQRPIVRDRIAPHVYNNDWRVIYNRIEFELNRGIGSLAVPDPEIMLRWSNDGGHTFGMEYILESGGIGDYEKKVYLNRCGYSRDRVFWLRVSDPADWGIVCAMLYLTECVS